MKKEITCEIINLPETEEGMKAFHERSSRALALAIYRSLSPEELDRFIAALRKAIKLEKNNDCIQKRPDRKAVGCEEI